MSLRLEMLQVARLAPRQLGEASAQVAGFLREQFGDDGGARDLKGSADLYYTVFALDGLKALQEEPTDRERLVAFLEAIEQVDDLDLVHTAALARCWAAVDETPSEGLREALCSRLEQHRSADGGYGPTPGTEHGTAYHAFLAFGAYQDLGREAPDAESLSTSVLALRTEDGGFTNLVGMPQSNVPATAAAVTLLRQLGTAVGGSARRSLMRCFAAEGGFKAMAAAPMPDLLSTATGLHALSGLGGSLNAEQKEACLDFVDSLWTGRGFCGTWADDHPDAEYTFYGLLALGHLSL